MLKRLGFVALLICVVSGCGDDEPAAPLDPTAKTVARDRAAAYFATEHYGKAQDALEPLLRGTPEPRDLVSAGIVEDWIGGTGAFDRALAYFRRAEKADPKDPAVHYVLGVLLKRGQVAESLKHLEKANELAPDDYPTSLHLAELYSMNDDPVKAAAVYERLQKVGVNNVGSWHLITLYNLAQLRIQAGRQDEGVALFDDWKRLSTKGLVVPGSEHVRQGNFGKLRRSDPGILDLPIPEWPAARTDKGLAGFAGFEHVRALTLVDDWTHDDSGCVVHPPDVVAWGKQGLVVARTNDGATYQEAVVLSTPVLGLEALDVDNDGDLDLAYWSESGVALLIARDGTFEPAAFKLPERLTPSDMSPVDFDHDGDMDLLLVGAFGARLWRNDGITVAKGSFSDATREARLPIDRAFTWCLVEDFDVDQDVDLLFGGPSGAVLADNLRAGQFQMRASDELTSGALAADMNADGRPDLLVPDGVRAGRPDGTFAAPTEKIGLVPVEILDWNLDGVADVVSESNTTLYLSAAFDNASVGNADPNVVGNEQVAAQSAAWADFDGDHTADRMLPTEGGVQFLRTLPSKNRGFTLALRGVKDNLRGVGAVVEIRAGPIYRRIFWDGEPQLIGIGERAQADVVRITWPNGVVQHDLDVEAGTDKLIEQAEGLVGSCPFLYTWNGTTYEYISDVLGITPMGLPMAPGMLVPPDHDEYVRVTGEQMKPRTLADGSKVYDMQFTEELREATYLDRAKLLVIDHPEGTEMYPTERFSFPPFPEHHINVVRDPLTPKAVGSDGKDWTSQLEKADGTFAAPFTPYRGQFQGLANPHFLELSFDKEKVAKATKLRLLCTGWFYWTDASVNVAAARTPGVDFIPPILQVPVVGNGGGWRHAGPPVGFPAGKTKTMVLDVSKILNRDDPRLRIFSTLRLYWDSIRLAVGDDEVSTVTELEPTSGLLWERGFSKPNDSFKEYGLEWFDWDDLDEPRWNQHPGRYTKFGEVLPLLQSVDDQFVIMGSGDALRVRFDASKAPPLKKGWRRDFLVFLDGWAKDRDPNTIEALYVDPLPFHGMSGYPYQPQEHYPDDEVHRRYQAEWNTRPSKSWIPSLVPQLSR